MESSTIGQLGASLSRRFETASTAFRLHVCAGRDAEELTEMMSQLSEIQREMRELRATAETERAHLEHAKSALASLRTERAKVEHLLANLPAHLPNMMAQQQQQQQQQPRAAGTGSGGRTGSGSGSAPKSAPPSAGSTAPSISYLTVAEFDSVPQYMRGRGTRDQANRMLDDINAVLAARYALIRRPPSGLAANQRKLRLECKREENAQTKGRRFFTDEDFKRFGSGLSRAQGQLLVMLRHVGRISALRGPGNVVRHVLT